MKLETLGMWVCVLSCVGLFAIPMDYSLPGSFVQGIFQAKIQEYCNELPFPTPGKLPNLGTELEHWQADSLPLSHLGIPRGPGHMTCPESPGGLVNIRYLRLLCGLGICISNKFSDGTDDAGWGMLFESLQPYSSQGLGAALDLSGRYKSLWQTLHQERSQREGQGSKCLGPGCPAALLDCLWKELIFSGKNWCLSMTLKNLLWGWAWNYVSLDLSSGKKESPAYYCYCVITMLPPYKC